MKIVGAFTFNDESHLILHQIETMFLFCDEIIALGDDFNNLGAEVAKSYSKESLFHLYFNFKTDKFKQRNEVGDRQNLLDHAKALNADIYFYTDVDEIVDFKSINRLKMLLLSLKDDEILSLPRYDFWKNCYNYRLEKSNKFSNQEIINILSPFKTQYACKLTNATNFNRAVIPNFHAKRLPNFKTKMSEIYDDKIKVLHYGYINQKIIDQKKNFYLTNAGVSKVNWGDDMEASTEEYKNRWGVGLLNRKV